MSDTGEPVLELAVLGPWVARGICYGADPGIFFPPRHDPGTEAKRICQHCPVLDECLDYALQAGELGVWGGKTEAERRTLRRKQSRKKSRQRSAA